VDGRTNPRGSSRANNGIDLAAFAGMTVHASAAGKVIFAGNEPERFGQLIVIDHGRGWVTAYAYLGRIDVKQGQQVAARQSIARIGKSGEARKPTLHFELRRDNVRAIRRPTCQSDSKAGQTVASPPAQPSRKNTSPIAR
jgi:murein DD-endopeptidase MepM/ murein hydrolase activator NlpD